MPLYVEAKDPSTSPARLIELAKDPALWPMIAENPNTPSELLRQLSQKASEQLSAALARNPNTPPGLLQILWQKFPATLLKNSVVSLLLLENPAFFASLPSSVFRRLLCRRDCPVVFWELAASHSDPQIRMVAASLGAPEALLQRLAADQSLEVRRYVARNAATPYHLLMVLATDTEESVRGYALLNSSMPLEHLRGLLRDPSAMVRSCLAQRAGVFG